jgi:hypothetical protein
MIEAHKFDGSLKLYRANIYANVKKGDDRLQVRIMPYMAGITGEDEANLPKYPPLYKGHVIRGYAETDSQSNGGKVTSIFVLANDDFTVGYCLDPINEFNGALKGALKTSWNYQETKSVLQRCGFMPQEFTYENITCDMNENGSLIELGAYNQPFKIIMTSTGDVIGVMAHRCFLMARSGPKSGTDSSYIDIRPTRIEIKSKVVDLSKSDAVILGHRGMNLVGTFAESAVPCEGVNLAPCKTIKV